MTSLRAWPRPLRGVVPPMITPLRDSETLDHAGLERVVGRLLDGGVAGVFILGTTGEGPSLSDRLRQETISAVCNLVQGRIPVLVGITETCLTSAVQLAKVAEECGADAVVTAPPYYFSPDSRELVRYVERITDSIGLPMVVYNIPSLTGCFFDFDAIRQLMQHDRIIGFKDSSGDMLYFHKMLQLIRQRPDWTVLMGPEELTAEAVLMGAHGGINGGANVHPRLYVDLCAAALAGDLARARELHLQVLDLAGRLYSVGTGSAPVIKGIKAALDVLGVCRDVCAEPLIPLAGPEKLLVRQHLRDLGLLE